MKKDIVLRLLEYGIKMVEPGVSQEEMESYLTNCGYKTQEISTTLELYWTENFKVNVPPDKVTKSTKQYLKSDGYFRYLQYKDIQKASINSWIAIGISFFLFVGSIVYSEIFPTDVSIEDIQFKEVRDFMKKSENNTIKTVQYHDSLKKDLIEISAQLDSVITTINIKKKL